MANSEDPDEMLHYAAFHLGLHCLLRQNQSSEKEINIFLEFLTCDLSVYTMDHPDLTVLNIKENIFSLKRVNKFADKAKMFLLMFTGYNFKLCTIMKTRLWGFSNNKGPEQPAHPGRLISAFVIHLFESIISKLVPSKISLF